MRLMKFLAVTTILALATPAWAESLNEALAKAYNTNPDLTAARATLRATDEQAPQALSGYRPQLSAAGSVVHTHEDTQNLGNDDYTSKAGSLTLQQPIFRGGRTAAAVREADNNIMAQRARLLDTEQTVLLRGVEAYLNVQRDQAVLELNQNNETVLGRQLKATRDRFNVGEVTKTDVSQAEARLSGAVAGRVQAEGDLASSKATYQRIFGEAPADLKKPDATFQLPASLDALTAEAQEKNPGVVAAQHTRTAADAVLDGVKGERLPTLTAEGSLARSYDAGSSSTGRVDNASVGLSLSWPLYTGGATSSRIREARQNVTRRSNEVDSAERGAIEVSTQAWEQYQTAMATLKSRQSQVSAAQIALDGVQQEASVGNRTVLDTLNAEQELLDAKVGLVRAQHDQLLAQYQVLSAAGRLTARELQLPVEYYDETSYSNQVRNQWIGSGE